MLLIGLSYEARPQVLINLAKHVTTLIALSSEGKPTFMTPPPREMLVCLVFEKTRRELYRFDFCQ